MESKIEELENYAYLDDTEWGNAVIALCNLWHNRAYITGGLLASLEEEITEQLTDAKTNAQIITEEVTQTYTNQYLEWLE